MSKIFNNKILIMIIIITGYDSRCEQRLGRPIDWYINPDEHNLKLTMIWLNLKCQEREFFF